MFPLKPFHTYLPFPHLAVMQCLMLLIMVLHSIANMLEMPSQLQYFLSDHQCFSLRFKQARIF